MKVSTKRNVNSEGSIKKFGERFALSIKNWKDLYEKAQKATASLNKDNILIEIDYSSMIDESLEAKIKEAIEIYNEFSKDKNVLVVIPQIDGINIEKLFRDYGIENYILIETNKENNEELRNEEYIYKVSQIAKGINGETYGKVCEISNPENMYANLLHHIENGILTLNYSAPTSLTTSNFSNIVVDNLLPKMTSGASKNWFNANYSEMIHYWTEKYQEAIENMNNAHNNIQQGQTKKTLIECAAQHPLVDGLYPGEEFSARLDKAVKLYYERKKAGETVKIYIPGSQHLIYVHENGEKVLKDDKISLSLSGANYLIEHGIPIEDIYSDEINRQISGDDGVYNTGDEAYVASEIFKRGDFNDLISVCSPGQLYRAANFFVTHGVIPTMYTAPTEKSYHNVVNELTGAIPNQLTIAPTWRKGSGFDLDEQIFINSRNPFDRRNDLKGRIQRSTIFALPESEEKTNQ